MEKNNAKISFDAALQMALYAQMERELETMPSPEELKSLYPQTTRWDERIYETLQKQEHKKRRRKATVAVLAGVDYNDNRLVCGQCGIAAHNLYSGLALFAARIATNLYG